MGRLRSRPILLILAVVSYAPMRLKSDLILLAVSMIWGSAFAAQRVAAAHLGPFLFNGLRFTVAILVLLCFARFRLNIPRKMLPWVVLTGAVLFLASALQQAGMQWTTAGNAGFITGLYVVIVPLVLVTLLRQPVGWPTWAAALAATLGALMLSTDGQLVLNSGDLLELVGAFVWAFQVILVGWVVRRMEVLSFVIGMNLVAGVLNLAMGGLLEGASLPGLVPAGWAVLYTGVFSVGIGYAMQAIGQRHSPPADAALIMSLESVFAAIFGFIFLGERLTLLQTAGCALIMVAILWVQIRPAPVNAAQAPLVPAQEPLDTP
jgi:drug/metabolite transporter (DMT)-like permease